MVSAHSLAQTLLAMVGQADDLTGREKALSDFVAFVRARGLELMLPRVVAELKKIAAREKEKGVLHIKTGRSVTKDVLAQIIAAIGADEASVEHVVDPELIGGFRAQFKGVEYDASVQRDVERLKQALV